LITALSLVGLQQFATSSVVSVFSKFLSYGVIGSVMILMLWIFMLVKFSFWAVSFPSYMRTSMAAGDQEPGRKYEELTRQNWN